MNDRDGQDAVVVSLRECRLVTERLLLLAGFGMGAAPPLREIFVAAQVCGLPALRFLHDSQSIVEGADLSTVKVRSHGDSVHVDCAGIPGLLVSSLLVDLAVDRARRHHEATIGIVNVTHQEFLPVLPVLARRHGVAAGLEGVAEPGTHDDVSVLRPPLSENRETVDERGRDSIKLVARAENYSTNYGASLWEHDSVEAEQAALRYGLRVESTVWWELYRRSILALSPDSPTSRRHAGATLVDADGKVHGEKDPELDLSIYSGDTEPAFDDSLGKEYRDAAS